MHQDPKVNMTISAVYFIRTQLYAANTVRQNMFTSDITANFSIVQSCPFLQDYCVFLARSPGSKEEGFMMRSMEEVVNWRRKVCGAVSKKERRGAR